MSSWIQKNIGYFQEWSLSSSVWSFSVLEFYDKKCINSICMHLEPRIQYFLPQDICTLIYSLAALNHKIDRFYQHVADSILPRISKFSSRDLTKITSAFAMLQFQHEELFTRISRVSLGMYQNFSFNDTLQIIYAFTRLKYEDHALLSAFAVQICKNWDLLKPQSVAQISGDYFRLSHYDEDLLNCLISRGWSVLEGGAGAHVARFFWGVTGLGVEKKNLIQLLDSEQLRIVATSFMDTSQIVDLMRIFVLIDYWEPEIWSIFFERTWWINPNQTKTETLRILYFVKQIAELFNHVKVPDFPSDTLSAMQTNWKKGKSPNPSAWQNTVARTLREIGYENLEEEVEVLNGIYRIDIVLNVQNQKIAVELDGSFHFSKNCPHVVLGRTKCRNRVLEKLGYKVITVSMYDWKALGLGLRVKNEMLMEKIEAALN
eukprot:TRINITY_DN4044_c1_g1_i2.p1 TRINITY_DN4044_c1_g1~~TRINITY_DN4044_c1_g1_i2.p1  ORF type:complete len:431 (+),score=72.58 TRINITY_DN4044_c1_g1_i2:1696-2988(+)